MPSELCPLLRFLRPFPAVPVKSRRSPRQGLGSHCVPFACRSLPLSFSAQIMPPGEPPALAKEGPSSNK